MDSLTTRNYNIEVISPAGNPEKLNFAVKYGADAVYFGGKDFNLRDSANNFDLNDIEAALKLCKENNVKTIFLLNSYLHENSIQEAKEYIESIKKFEFNAIMISGFFLSCLTSMSWYAGEYPSAETDTLHIPDPKPIKAHAPFLFEMVSKLRS